MNTPIKRFLRRHQMLSAKTESPDSAARIELVDGQLLESRRQRRYGLIADLWRLFRMQREHRQIVFAIAPVAGVGSKI